MNTNRTYDFENAQVDHFNGPEWTFYWDDNDDFFYVDVDREMMTVKSDVISEEQEREAVLRMMCYMELVKLGTTGNKYHDGIYETIEEINRNKRLQRLGLLP